MLNLVFKHAQVTPHINQCSTLITKLKLNALHFLSIFTAPLVAA